MPKSNILIPGKPAPAFHVGTYGAKDHTPLRVGHLRDILRGVPDEMPVEMSTDEEGNFFNHLLAIDVSAQKVVFYPDNANMDPANRQDKKEGE
jgi:hypothetical protein